MKQFQFLSSQGNRSLLAVIVSPRAKKSRVMGIHGDRLKISVAAPPADGEANSELLRFVAELFGVAARKVELVNGHSAKRKQLAIEMSVNEAAGRLEDILAGVLPP